MTAVTRTQLPESPRAAREYDQIAAFYRREGLCDHCAAHAGHRHSCGWLTDPKPPCSACWPIVQSFPKATADPDWRQHLRGRPSASSAPSAATRGVAGSPELWAASTGTLEGWRVFGALASRPGVPAVEVTR